MERESRKRVDMTRRAYGFNLQHPSQATGYTGTMARLGDRLLRWDELSTQQERATAEAVSATLLKQALRLEIEEDHLRHLCRAARSLVPPDPELVARFRMPGKRLNKEAFVAATRAILALAKDRAALFVAEGMPESFAEDLEGLLARYLAACDEKARADAARVGAVAEQPVVAKEMMALVRRLDGINRKRWQKNPELLAAWRSARDVTWPQPKPPAEGAGGGTIAAR